MLAYRYPLIAREGWLWIAVAALFVLAVHFLLGWVALPLWLGVLGLLFLFRDPARKVPAVPLAIVSPVDGTVVSIERVRDDYLNRTAIRVRIRMEATGVYSVHSPMEGKVQEQWLAVPGANNTQGLNDDVSSYAQWVQSDEGDDVVLAIASGVRWWPPRFYAQSGERIGQGQRCGYIPLGATVDVLVPDNSRIDIGVNDKVRAATDVVATLVRAGAEPARHEAPMQR